MKITESKGKSIIIDKDIVEGLLSDYKKLKSIAVTEDEVLRESKEDISDRFKATGAMMMLEHIFDYAREIDEE